MGAVHDIVINPKKTKSFATFTGTALDIPQISFKKKKMNLSFAQRTNKIDDLLK